MPKTILKLLKPARNFAIIKPMKKKIGKQQKNYNRAKKRRERLRREEYEKNYDERTVAEYKELTKGQSFAESHGELGKLLYSYSDGRSWIDLPSGQKFRKTFCHQRVFLFALAVLLCVWFVTALIYQLSVTSDAGKTLLRLLPSFILIAACVAILLISVFMGWGKLLRWGFRHNLIRGKGAIGRRRIEQMKLELSLADSRMANENRIDVTPDYVVLTVYGKEEIFKRELIKAKVYKRENELSLTFYSGGRIIDFPASLSAEEYVPLKKALRDQLTAMRIDVADDDGQRRKLVGEIPALIMTLFVFAAGVMLVVTHYLWITEIPPFLGVFFIGMSFLALCNVLSFIPAVNAVGIPLVFSLVLLVVPPWALVWFHRNIFHNDGNVLSIILNCDVLTAGFSFFTVIGAYVFTFAVTRLVDYVIFGAIK